MPALIVYLLGGGDACFSVVDDELWAQIEAIDVENMSKDDYVELVGYLSADDPAIEMPEGTPERKGQVLQTFYTQRFVPELANIVGPLSHILTLG